MVRNGRLNGHDIGRIKYESSGISVDHAKVLGYRTLTAEQTKRLSPSFQEVPSLLLPYFDFKGKTTKFFRLRYLGTASGGFQTEQTMRYVQPPGSLNEVYMPPVLEESWERVALDTNTRLLITEGELKAASACIRGYACIGLGGVNMFQSTRRGIGLLPQLEQFQWRERSVHIMFDSDAASNPRVVQAQIRLAKELQELGAMPYIDYIPPSRNGEKQGLDDFIVNEGTDALNEVIEHARIVNSAEALWKLNEEVAYIKDPGMVIEVTTGRLMGAHDFAGHIYANRSFFEEVTARNGEPSVKRAKIAPKWLEWDGRREFRKMVYAPGKPREVDRQWNSWKGWGCEPKKGELGPWKRLLDYIFDGHESERKWFERWCAYPLQHPGTKLYSSVLVWGRAQGTGKSLIGYTLKHIYGENFAKIGNKELHSGDNDWAENKQFILGDEITRRENKFDDSETLRTLITQEEMRINIKYVPRYTVIDCVNYYFTSNHSDSLFLEDLDRRQFVHEAPDEPLPIEFYRKVYDPWKNGEGPSALFHHLLHLPLGDFDPKAPAPFTQAKKEMIEDNKGDLARWVGFLAREPDKALMPLGDRQAAEAELLTVRQLMRCCDPENAERTPTNRLTRELKRGGFKYACGGQYVNLPGVGLQALMPVRNAKQWRKATAKEAIAHWESTFAPKTAKHKGGK